MVMMSFFWDCYFDECMRLLEELIKFCSYRSYGIMDNLFLLAQILQSPLTLTLILPYGLIKHIWQFRLLLH